MGYFKVSLLCIIAILFVYASTACGYNSRFTVLNSLSSLSSSVATTHDHRSSGPVRTSYGSILLAEEDPQDSRMRDDPGEDTEIPMSLKITHEWKPEDCNMARDPSTDSRSPSVTTTPKLHIGEDISLPISYGSRTMYKGTYGSRSRFWPSWRVVARSDYSDHGIGNKFSEDGDESKRSSSNPSEKRDSDHSGNNGDQSSPSSSDTPVIVAAILGTILVCLVAGLLFYFLRRLWQRRTKISDPEYPFTSGSPNQITSHSKLAAFPLSERSKVTSRADSDGNGQATTSINTLASKSHSISQPTVSISTTVAPEPSPESGTGQAASQSDSRDLWESKNFYATPKNTGPPVHRAGKKRKTPATSSKVSGASRSSKSTTSSGFSRGSRTRRARTPGSVITVSDATTTEVSSIRFSPNTERQMEIDERIQELQGKLNLLQRTIRANGISRDAKTGSVTLANMTHDYRVWKWKRQIEKLKGLKESDWAYGKTDVVPAGLYKFDGTSTSNL